MHVINHLSSTKRPLVSVEIIPPKRGANIADFHRAIDSIAPFEIPFVNVTSHAADVDWLEQADGSFRRRVKRKSPGTFGLCAMLKYKYGIDPVPHLLCAGFTREETEDALIELNYLGIDNVLAIRGDGEHRHVNRPDRSINHHADQLVKQIANMNCGVYQDQLIEAAKTEFCIGVGCYPEKHFESPNQDFDVQILLGKEAAGAQFAVCQMFYNNDHYFDFVDRARAAGVTIPILPGLKILTTQRQITLIPRVFHVDIPVELATAITEARTRKEVREIGIRWANQQAIELFDRGVPCIHFYVMQNTKAFVEVMNRLTG